MRLRITADAHQWIVNEVCVRGEKAKTPGEEYLNPTGFYPSLPHALRGASDELLRSACPPGGLDLADLPAGLDAVLARAEKQVEVSR